MAPIYGEVGPMGKWQVFIATGEGPMSLAGAGAHLGYRCVPLAEGRFHG